MPNRGLADAVRGLRALPPDSACPVIASVAGFSYEELLRAAEAVEPYVAAVEIGLVSPNTTESERMDEQRIFQSLVEGLARTVTPASWSSSNCRPTTRMPTASGSSVCSTPASASAFRG